MRHTYHLLNVFCQPDLALSGNPLCVFESCGDLSDDDMQAYARQFNLSETVFLLPSATDDARVRIFTPDHELPFAGHPTLGSAFMVHRLAQRANDTKQVRLEMRAGTISVNVDKSRCTLQARAATCRPFRGDRSQLALALGLAPEDLFSSPVEGEPLWVDTGTEQLIIPVRNADCVRAARPLQDRLAGVSEGRPRPTAYVFTRLSDHRVLARYFFSVNHVMQEDPATGSACTNLGGWWIAHNRSVPWHCEIQQGQQIHRPSTLQLSIDSSSTIAVGGLVTYIGRGEFQC